MLPKITHDTLRRLLVGAHAHHVKWSIFGKLFATVFLQIFGDKKGREHLGEVEWGMHQALETFEGTPKETKR